MGNIVLKCITVIHNIFLDICYLIDQYHVSTGSTVCNYLSLVPFIICILCTYLLQCACVFHSCLQSLLDRHNLTTILRTGLFSESNHPNAVVENDGPEKRPPPYA